MVARVSTVAFHGIEVRPVDVEVQISGGLPAFNIVGLPDKAVAESKGKRWASRCRRNASPSISPLRI